LKTFRKGLQGDRPALTAELSMRNAPTADGVLRQAEILAASVDGIQLGSDGPAAEQASPLALASLLLRNGIDPIPRLNCRDANRIALQSELLGLRALGVTSLIIDRDGRGPDDDDSPTRPVHDVSRRELIATAAALNEEEWASMEHEFVIGTETDIGATQGDWNTEALLARAGAGARFMQTAVCFNTDMLREFMARLVEDKITWQYSVMVTLAPLPSAQFARRLAERNPLAELPSAIIERLESAADEQQEGIGICAEMMRDIARIPGVSGFNLLTCGRPEAVLAVIEQSGAARSGSAH